MSSSRGCPQLFLPAQRCAMVTSCRNKWTTEHTHMLSDCSHLFGLRCSPLQRVFGHFVSFRNSRRLAGLHSGKRYCPGNTLSVVYPLTSQSFVHSVAVGVEISICKDAEKMLTNTPLSRGEKRQVGLRRISASAGTFVQHLSSPQQEGTGPDLFTSCPNSTPLPSLYIIISSQASFWAV